MAYLDAIKGSNNKRQFFISASCRIGRTPDNDLCIEENKVSRHHAQIRLLGERYVIEDLGSTNGVQVNHRWIAPFKPQALFDKDHITISESEFIFHNPKKDGSTDLINQSRKEGSGTHRLNGLSLVMDQTPQCGNSATVLDAMLKTYDTCSGLPETKSQNLLHRLQAMIRISGEIATIYHLDVLLDKIMDQIFELFPSADRSFILLRNNANNTMTPQAARKRTTEFTEDNQVFEISQTILSNVIANKQSILSSNACKDQRFLMGDSIAKFSIRSLMYVPIIYKEEILGVITVDTTSVQHAFTRDDLSMLTSIAGQVGLFLKNAALFKEIQEETRLKTQLARYLSAPVIDGILTGAISLELGGEEKRGTVLFGDIIGFTALSEKLSAIQVIQKINRCFSTITEVVGTNYGTLHKFDGDMFMAFWNVLVPENQSEFRGVSTGMMIQQEIWKLNATFESEESTAIYMGTGCITGSFAGGNIGGANKMEYTVIGDTINMGKRIESLSGRWQVFVSEETFKAIATRSIAVELPPAIVKGKTRELRILSIRGLAESDSTLRLLFPIHFRDNSGQYTTPALMVHANIQKNPAEISIIAKQPLPDGDVVYCKTNFQELITPFEFAIAIDSKTPMLSHDREILTMLHCHIVTCRPEFRSFLQPGTLSISQKPWEEMHRV